MTISRPTLSGCTGFREEAVGAPFAEVPVPRRDLLVMKTVLVNVVQAVSHITAAVKGGREAMLWPQ